MPTPDWTAVATIFFNRPENQWMLNHVELVKKIGDKRFDKSADNANRKVMELLDFFIKTYGEDKLREWDVSIYTAASGSYSFTVDGEKYRWVDPWNLADRSTWGQYKVKSRKAAETMDLGSLMEYYKN